MDRRTLLTLSTSACLCGTYAVYRMLVSPLVSLGPELRDERSVPGREFSSNSSEKHPQAEQYLSDQPWAAAAKYEIRNDPTYVYFKEYKPIEQTGRVRFKPFAMIWREKGHDPKEPPITIVCDSAVVEFAEKFEIASIKNPGRIIGGNLEGAVKIRGPNGMAIDGRDFNFAERALRAWSDDPVAFAHGPHSGSGNGIELELIPERGPPKEDKPAVAGVRTLRLLKDVVMNLVAEPKENGAPSETVHVTSAGSFEFGVDSHVASFQKKVRVVRSTGSDQFDTLHCQQLTLVFEPESPAETDADVAAASPSASKPADATSPFGGKVKLQFRRLRAEGAKTTVVSQRSEMRAVMQELTYDKQARVVALRDAKQVQMLQRNNELRCPEVTAVLDEAGQIEQATCRGAGKLFSYAKDAENLRQPHGKKPIEFAAEWLKQLRMEPDAVKNLDLIEFSGQAVLSQPGKMALRADVVRLWVTPDNEGQRMRGMTDRSIGAEDSGAKPKMMLALGNAEFASPKITGATGRLEVWFHEGPLPQPPTAGPADRSRKHGVLRPTRMPPGRQAAPVLQSFQANVDRPTTAARGGLRRDTPVRPAAQADVGDAVPTGPRREERGGKPAAVEHEQTTPDEPLHVVADLMCVQTIMDGDEPHVAEVVTEGRVHVTQQHVNADAPFDLRGDRLHLLNDSETHQVIDVTGKPAHIHDRGMRLEGDDIHFDRGQNLARVEGPGVLGLPVRKGLDGKPLESPQLLDVFWQEKMQFDGETADFFANVRTQLSGSEMRCEEMHVTLAQRISFSEEVDRSQQADVRLVVCRDGVELKSHEYKENHLVEIRTARGFEFELDQTTGKVIAQGPGTLVLLRRGTGNRAGLANVHGVKANRPLKAEAAEWEYTRVDFSGRMNGNTKEQTTRFTDRVRIVYGPVGRATDTIDADELPLNGGWMRCEELDLTQLPGSGSSRETSMAVVGRGNAELEGRSEHGLFNAQAGRVSFDGSKGLYILEGEGGHDATIWREQHVGSTRSSIPAQRMEFIPSLDKVNIQGASGAQGGR